MFRFVITVLSFMISLDFFLLRVSCQDTLNLDGRSYVIMMLINRPISSYHDTISFKFRTNEANGNIIYSEGTQGDIISLRLQDNKIVLSIDLSGPDQVNTITAGSLLDDSEWHNVTISRHYRHLNLTVDNYTARHEIFGDSARLDLNAKLYLAGLPPTIQRNSKFTVKQNFTGCIQDLLFNTTSIIREINNDAYRDSYSRFGDTPFECRTEKLSILTFSSDASFIKIPAIIQNHLNVSLDFRTFNEEGLILYHTFLTSDSSPKFFAVFLSKKKLHVDISTAETVRALNLEPFPGRNLNDGSWHSLSIKIEQNGLAINLDGDVSHTKRRLTLQTGTEFLVGGGNYFRKGMVGCIRRFAVNDIYTALDSLPPNSIKQSFEGDVVLNACKMVDRCNPNPCEHKGICRQDHVDFSCDCSKTGYGGAVCHVPRHPLSCDAYQIEFNITSKEKKSIMIDVDGSGPLEPFQITCDFKNGRAQTHLNHRSETPTEVVGYEEPGSYVKEIIYNADFDQITVLVNNSYKCHQFLKYECKNARLFNTPYTVPKTFRPFTWWMSRNNQRMSYWGGALPDSRKCQCGMYGTCYGQDKWCNCDSIPASSQEWGLDEGYIREKEFLPIRSIHVGDTSLKRPEKRARYTIGPLICEGDYLFDNVVTFRLHDSIIPVPTFEMGESWDIYLQFKTTTEFGVLLHAKGPTDFIKLAIISAKAMQFTFDSGFGNQKIEIQSASKLNDDNWHSVSIEWNRKEARLTIDGSQTAAVDNQAIGFRPIKFTSKMFIGATQDEKEGYVGCVRAFSFNGKFIDLVKLTREGDMGRPLYGVNPGCVGKCQSNPCLNNGTCYEKYSSYTCDCQWTAFKGRICADEIGVNLRSDNYIKYDFDTQISTLEETIRVGFTTTENRGMILGVSSYSDEYLNLMMSTSGHLRLVFDFGFERQEIIIKNENFALGQHHDVRIRRSERGRRITIYVDNYEPIIYTFSIPEKADAQFNRLKSIYIGRNESMNTGDGFVGCISRVSFDDHFPLRRLFQQNRRSNVLAFPSDDSVREDTCGIESFTHPPEETETRPPPRWTGVTDDGGSGHVIAIVSLSGAAIIIIAVVLLLLSGRILGQHKGDYVTNEDKGARDALDPDMAVVKGKTGPEISKQNEFFI